MYVCLCHAVTEDDVRKSVAAGAGSTREVKAACGMKPGCGSCVKRLCALIGECRATSQQDPDCGQQITARENAMPEISVPAAPAPEIHPRVPVQIMSESLPAA